MRDAKPAPDQPGETAAPKRAGPSRWLARIAIGCLLLILLLAGLGLAAIKTEWGARTAWRIAIHALPGKLSGEFIGGTVADGIELRQFLYRDAHRIIRIDRIAAAWQLSRAPLTLTIARLHIGQADVTLLPSPPTPMTLPRQIRLPLAIDLQDAALQEVIVHKDATSSRYADIRLKAHSDRVHHALQLENAMTPFGQARAAIRLDGTAPFALSGTAGLAGGFQDERYSLDASLSGSLSALGVQLKAVGDKLAGSADIQATPFAPLPFQRAQIMLDHVNPKLFNPAAPKADLDIRAILAPLAGTAAPDDLSQLVVAGPVSIANAQAGPLDKGLLPLESVRADVTLAAHRQQLAQLKARLAGNAMVEGNGEMQGASGGRFELLARGLDLHALYSALRPTRLSGPLTIDLAESGQHLLLDLAGRSLSVTADAQLSAQQVVLRSAQLRAGPARLKISGTLERSAPSAYTVEGSLASFNPALFLETMQITSAKSGKRPALAKNADINLDFHAQGELHPEPSAQLRFEIHDSSYDKLPMTGAGMLHVRGKRLLPSDARISIAGNEAAVKGSFGAPGDRASFTIDAPALQRLGFGLSGLLQAQGELAGSLDRPLVNAKYSARQLAVGDNLLQQLSGEAHIDGVPGSDPNARVNLVINAQGVRSGQVNLDKFNANINGSYASHTMTLASNGRVHGQPLDVTLAAHGSLSERQQGLAWDGTLGSLENRGFPRLSIKQPVQISAAPGTLSLGPARMSIEQAMVELKGLDYHDGAIRSQGAFSALDVGHLLALLREFTGARPPIKTDLVLDGSWNVTLADSASGFAQIQRRRGDLVVIGNYGESTLGLNDLRLAVDLQGERMVLDSRINASRIGSLSAQAQIGLLHSDGRLTLGPDAPLSAHVTANIPRLSNLGTLAGPRVALNGSADMDLTASGSLGTPRYSGTINGQDLALTLFDQGVRLRDGTARIALKDNIIELREVVFHGGDGSLRVSGRIPLDQSNPDLAAVIEADHLQLLADPSRQLTLSGQANAANIDRQLQITGKFTVDRALISMPDKAAPKLDDDVVIVRKGEQPQAGSKKVQVERTVAAAGAPALFPPRVNISLGLGNDFRFKGSGADLLLAGLLTIRSGPGQPPQAFGTVRVVNGVYEAFGTKLAVERGVLSFNGPFSNPSINILAMRRNQDVPAGVQVTGDVQQPRIGLVSEPNLPEEEQLSWLVFGHGITEGSAGTSQARTAFQGAALGLLNRFGSSRIAKGVGLDQLSIGASEFGMTSKQVVTLGKEISDRLSIGYEQSLAGAESVVKLTYDLTRHWSVVVRGGAIAGMDLLYSKRFDRFGPGKE